MERNRYLIIERYGDDIARYDMLIDHGSHDVYYVVTPASSQAPGVNLREAAGHRVLDQFTTDSVFAAAVELAAGRRFDRVVATSEWDLDAAARVRTRFGVPGMGAEEVALVRDKVIMKQHVREAGLAVPNFVAFDTPKGFDDAVEQIGFPFITKPRRLAASRGVYRFLRAEELASRRPQQDWTDFEAEEFVPGQIYHIDGVIRSGRFWLCQPSRYLGTCLGFAAGRYLGSVMVDDSTRADRLREFARVCLAALRVDDSAFHLELIENDGSRDPGRRGQLVFLEIGARVGGGPIPFLYRDLYGVNLVEEWLRLQLRQAPGRPHPVLGDVGGFLIVPEPHEVPCMVVSAKSLLGHMPTLVNERLPFPGTVLDGQGGYEQVGGTFIFRGRSSATVERDIRRAAAEYSLQVRRIEAAVNGPGGVK